MRKLILLVALSIALIACEDNDDVAPTNDNVETISEFLIRDNGLRISLLTDDEDNETNYFNSFVFVFNTNGSLAATSSSETVTGSYTLLRDEGRIELSMNFPNIQNFSELNDDWYFISIDDNTIRFDDGGDKLEFQRQ